MLPTLRPTVDKLTLAPTSNVDAVCTELTVLLPKNNLDVLRLTFDPTLYVLDVMTEFTEELPTVMTALAVRLADTVKGMSIAWGLDTYLALVILVIYLSSDSRRCNLCLVGSNDLFCPGYITNGYDVSWYTCQVLTR